MKSDTLLLLGVVAIGYLVLQQRSAPQAPVVQTPPPYTPPPYGGGPPRDVPTTEWGAGDWLRWGVETAVDVFQTGQKSNWW